MAGRAAAFTARWRPAVDGGSGEAAMTIVLQLLNVLNVLNVR
ncbi:hypothetical protein I545_5401 [Mycobacterium kansasii 662]|uniref:Uncharacterized protein n=2 Tax=Mycobacterium kansasii TaxID=1768 RepID=A0A1V3WGK4_MYCKA|nr:hypothetical protein I547_1490 [Mycobacterium kansasii 824]EUA11764.1 hypothetical protein I545_5401 [Mycobacterium kansasii 662]KEP43853.1 hypothetical protein MKSMC1_09290 [Mycobacterium kansasii]OOK65556.1 hypothetical protein BZL30_8509 [Mycobacterium kansasii]